MKKLFEGPPSSYEVRPRVEREPLHEVFMYLRGSHEGEEIVYRIGLLEGGAVALDEVPEDIRSNWESFGIRVNIGNAKPVFPSQGAVFLEQLITQGSSGYGAVFLKHKKTK